MSNKYIKLFLLNIIIVAVVVFTYSEGFLDLRPTDESIIRAGMSIFIAIASAFSFFYGNMLILKSDNRRLMFGQDSLPDINQARAILKSFHGGKYFGRIADTTVDQLDRLTLTMNRADRAIEMKFEAGSMAYDRYVSTISAAKSAAINNCVGMANRMQLFDESEYAKLENYKNDDIPDDIQEKQIALYKKNREQIESAVAANEKLILALDTMSVELTSQKDSMQDDNQQSMLLDEIEKLTDQVKLYNYPS